jgi:integration host factor subunit beta
MTRSELAQRLVERYPHLLLRDAEIVVHTIFGEIAAALSRGDRVELRRFGAFSVRRLAGRVGRNPRTGAKVNVPEKHFAAFRTGEPLHDRLNPQEDTRDGWRGAGSQGARSQPPDAVLARPGGRMS